MAKALNYHVPKKAHTPVKHVLLTNSNRVAKYKIILPPSDTKQRQVNIPSSHVMNKIS